MANYRAATRAVPCAKEGDAILVCARRDARRYRIATTAAPLFHDAEPRAPMLLNTRAPACGQGAFTVRCGKVGVSVTRALGPGTNSGEITVDTEREKAP